MSAPVTTEYYDPDWDMWDVPMIPPDEPWLHNDWYAALIHNYTIDWILGGATWWPPLRELTA